MRERPKSNLHKVKKQPALAAMRPPVYETQHTEVNPKDMLPWIDIKSQDALTVPTPTTRPTAATGQHRYSQSLAANTASNLKISEDEINLQPPNEEDDGEQYSSVGDEAVQSNQYDIKTTNFF